MTVTVRKACPQDAEAIARIYVESWHDTYPALLPARALMGLTVERQISRWRNTIAVASREEVLVAEDGQHNITGMASFGRARDTTLGFDGEIYTLYVHPMLTGQGIGRALLGGGFAALAARGYASCVIWAHAQNPARFFYEAMGGHLVAERTTSIMGTAVPEAAFGWRELALAEAHRLT
jgi:ribosomal protein S18 acetylase RimI-like enzyme